MIIMKKNLLILTNINNYHYNLIFYKENNKATGNIKNNLENKLNKDYNGDSEIKN